MERHGGRRHGPHLALLSRRGTLGSCLSADFDLIQAAALSSRLASDATGSG